MGNKLQRLLKLEAQTTSERFEVTPEQIRTTEKAGPTFRKRHIESSQPGELLAADTFDVGQFKGVGKVYLHAVVDTYGAYLFGFLHTSNVPESAVSVPHNDALPLYSDRQIPVAVLLTDDGREFCSTSAHLYKLCLALNGIEHRRTEARSPKTKGFVERYQHMTKEALFGLELCETFYVYVDALQADFDARRRHYSFQRIPTWATATAASAPSTPWLPICL